MSINFILEKHLLVFNQWYIWDFFFFILLKWVNTNSFRGFFLGFFWGGIFVPIKCCKNYVEIRLVFQNTLLVCVYRLCYVRSITCHASPVKVVAVSSTLGDIASVSQKGPGSELMLHSINATLIARSVMLESSINCLSFSNAPEGQSVNILAGGMDNGVVRLAIKFFWNANLHFH